MKLEGSCHCCSVSFSFMTHHPYPYQRCYCSVCRKTQGGGGFAVNLVGDATSLRVRGKKFITVYRATIRNPEDLRGHRSSAERSFCLRCGSGLWLYSPEWPNLIHPFASAIDTPLPKPPVHTHLMLDFKPDWVEVQGDETDLYFERYSEQSIAEWHQQHRLQDSMPA